MTAVLLSLESFGDHDTVEGAEAEILELIAAHPAYTQIAGPGITIGRYMGEGPRFDLGPGDTSAPGDLVVRYKAYATIVKPDPNPPEPLPWHVPGTIYCAQDPVNTQTNQQEKS